MYSVISTYQQAVIGSIGSQDISEYEWLRQNVGQANNASYQRRYRKFWVMRGVSANFYTSYFAALSAAINQPPTIPTYARRSQCHLRAAMELKPSNSLSPRNCCTWFSHNCQSTTHEFADFTCSSNSPQTRCLHNKRPIALYLFTTFSSRNTQE